MRIPTEANFGSLVFQNWSRDSKVYRSYPAQIEMAVANFGSLVFQNRSRDSKVYRSYPAQIEMGL